MSYGVSFVRILQKNDRIITASYCDENAERYMVLNHFAPPVMFLNSLSPERYSSNFRSKVIKFIIHMYKIVAGALTMKL